MTRRAMTPEERIKAGNAERLLTDPAYIEAKRDAEATILTALRKLPLTDTDNMVAEVAKLQVLDLLDRVLRVRVDRAKVASMTHETASGGRG